MAGIYGDEFEKNMNVLTSPANIRATARKFVEFEKANGPYSFGMFAKRLLPRPADWADEYGSTKGYNNWESMPARFPKKSPSASRPSRLQTTGPTTRFQC